MTQKQPHHHRSRRHRSSACRRHPTVKPTTGFCASCLRERLASIESSLSPSSSSASSTAPVASDAQLRRTRSYSTRPIPAADVEPPRRRSCDVRSHTLHDLFSVDDGKRSESLTRKCRVPHLGPELKEEEAEEEVYEDENEGGEEEEIKGFDEGKPRKLEVEDFEEGGEYRTMKEFIDLEWGNGKKKNTGKDFRVIASVFSKKLMNWSMKQQRNKEEEEGCPDAGSGKNGKIHRSSTEATQSEVAKYGLGRRSCDTDPRFSLVVGRISLEEPRASWDGCLIDKTHPELTALDSVKEDMKDVTASNAGDEDEEEVKNPGGSDQTRDYYADSRRGRSFDRSSSIKRLELPEVEELKAISNTKVSPETVGLFHGAKLLVTEKELRDSNWYSRNNYKLESVDNGSKGDGSVDGEVTQEGFELKKPRRKWAKGWNIWGLMMQRRNETKQKVKVEKSLKLEENVIEGSLAESLLKLRRVAKGEANGSVSQKLMRSYSVSARNSCDGVIHGGVGVVEGGRSSCDGLFHGSGSNGVKAGRSSCDGLFHGVVNDEKSREIQLNTNTGSFSPSNLDNSLLRFYLTPLRSSKTNKAGKSRLQNSSAV